MEFLGIFGLVALGLSISLVGLPSRVEKLERQIKKIIKQERGEPDMAKILEGLKGKDCKISFENGIQSVQYRIEDLDDEWISLTSVDKKGLKKMEIFRIEDISKVEVL
ncbi:MAG: hypothetical protein WBK75_08545 [Acutalibacteraceae bacterium]|nr:hypothetical protein [Clostridiales bacterium]